MPWAGRLTLGRLALLAAGCTAACGASGRDFGDFLSYNAGLFAFQPQLDVGAFYTDNLFYSEGALKESDLAGLFSPGLRLQYGRDGDNQVSLEYTHDEFVYLDNSMADTSQDRFLFRLQYQMSRVKVDGRSTFDMLSSFLGGSINQQGRLVDRDVFNNDYKVTWDITDKTDVYVDGQYNDTDFERGVGLLDIANLRGSLGASYQITTRFRLFTEGFYGRSMLDNNLASQPPPSDSSFYGGFLGVRGQFTPKISGSLKVGYEFRDFDAGGSQSASTPAVSADVTWAAGPLTALILRYDRGTTPSPQFGAQNIVSDAVRLTVNQLIGVTGRWALQGTGGYTQWEFQEQFRTFNLPLPTRVDLGRTDSTITAGMAFVYQPQPWFRASLSYNFEKFSTSFNDSVAAAIFRLSEYTANRVMLTLSLGY